MMPTKTLSEVLAAAPTATSLSGLSTMCVDSSGNLEKSTFQVQIMLAENGAYFLKGSRGLTLMRAYSKSNPSIGLWALVHYHSLTQFYPSVLVKDDSVTFHYNQQGSVQLGGVTDPVYVKIHFPCEIL